MGKIYVAPQAELDLLLMELVGRGIPCRMAASGLMGGIIGP
jgi:hypothetical protein